jgi:hypothetical protein
MKKVVLCLSLSLLILGVAGVNTTFALDFGEEITVYDGASKSSDSWWGNTNEDHEVEYNNIKDQSWDLEGMFLDGSDLTIVGGYDFQNGKKSVYTGDIFLDITGDMTYGSDVTSLHGNGNKNITNVFGYDYVVDLSFDERTLSSTYNVYKIDETAVLKSPYYRQNDSSGAYRYVSGGELVGSGSIAYQSGLTDEETGFTGGYHNALSIDLSFLDETTDFTAHYTMGCGNDDLIGKGTFEVETPPVVSGVPEPGTILLLGAGLLGLGAVIRKRR